MTKGGQSMNDKLVKELKEWGAYVYKSKVVRDRELAKILAKASQIAEPTVDADFWTELNALYEKSLYNHEIALKVVGAFDIKDLLLKYKPKPTVDNGACGCGHSKTFHGLHGDLFCDACGKPRAKPPVNEREDKEEPLACLADRKGCSMTTRKRSLASFGHKGILLTWFRNGEFAFEAWEDTYEAAELAARQYLMGLTDVKGGE